MLTVMDLGDQAVAPILLDEGMRLAMREGGAHHIEVAAVVVYAIAASAVQEHIVHVDVGLGAVAAVKAAIANQD